jgi:hypothetical protein
VWPARFTLRASLSSTAGTVTAPDVDVFLAPPQTLSPGGLATPAELRAGGFGVAEL